MVCLEYDITSHIIFCVFFVFLMLHYITETCPQTTGLNPTDQNSSSWQVRLSNITTRQTSKARSLCYKLPDSAPLGLAMCCRLVGNTQTLNPLGRQLAQTKRCFPPWQNTHMHTREKKPEKGKTSVWAQTGWDHCCGWKKMVCLQTNMFFTNTFIQKKGSMYDARVNWTHTRRIYNSYTICILKFMQKSLVGISYLINMLNVFLWVRVHSMTSTTRRKDCTLCVRCIDYKREVMVFLHRYFCLLLIPKFES